MLLHRGSGEGGVVLLRPTRALRRRAVGVPAVQQRAVRVLPAGQSQRREVRARCWDGTRGSTWWWRARSPTRPARRRGNWRPIRWSTRSATTKSSKGSAALRGMRWFPRRKTTALRMTFLSNNILLAMCATKLRSICVVLRSVWLLITLPSNGSLLQPVTSSFDAPSISTKKTCIDPPPRSFIGSLALVLRGAESRL